MNMINVTTSEKKKIAFEARALPFCITTTCDVKGLVVSPEFNRYNTRETRQTVKDKARDSERWKLKRHRASEDKRQATIALLLDVKVSLMHVKCM